MLNEGRLGLAPSLLGKKVAKSESSARGKASSLTSAVGSSSEEKPACSDFISVQKPFNLNQIAYFF
jgi:hypothetical protein